MRKVVFLLGKGGVGKTTTSAALSYCLADNGYSVYLVSIDPAHNLSDIALTNLKEKTRIYKALFAEEVDIDGYLKEFLTQTTRRMKETYKYLEIINLESMFDILKYSPGMEEYAIMYALKDKIEENSEFDFIVVDTPPTGLMLKIFTLPFSSKMWIEKLIKWRVAILDRRAAISNIKPSSIPEDLSKDPATDKVLKELGFQKDKVEFLIDLLKNTDKTKIGVVLNEDKMSLNETLLIEKSLKELGLNLNFIILNKEGLLPKNKSLQELFSPLNIISIPYVKNATQAKTLIKLGERIVNLIL